VEALDPTQLALAKKGVDLAEEAARGFLSRVLGSPLEEVGALLHDKVRARRFRNQVDMLVKARDMLDEAGISPKAMPLKVLVPLLDGVSLEDDPEMAKRWAALLANAADAKYRHASFPSFTSILSELSPVEAKIMDTVYDTSIEALHGQPGIWEQYRHSPGHGPYFVGHVASHSRPPEDAEYKFSLVDAAVIADERSPERIPIVVYSDLNTLTSIDLSETDSAIMLDNMARLRLLRADASVWTSQSRVMHGRLVRIELSRGRSIALTNLGIAFVEACRGPAEVGLSSRNATPPPNTPRHTDARPLVI
jgi:hypothetical protein